MITELTDDQKLKLVEYRERYFAQATSTEPADRPRAEAAAMALAEIAGVKIKTIIWVDSPEFGAQAYSDIMIKILNLFSDLLNESLSDSLCDSFRNSFINSLRISLNNSLKISFRASLRISLTNSLWDSFLDLFNNPIWNLIWNLLEESLNNSLNKLLNDSLKTSLSDSIWNSLWNFGLLVYYMYSVNVLNIKYDEKSEKLFYLHNEIAASCFALWIINDTIILCERPTECIIKDNKLISIKFRGDK